MIPASSALSVTEFISVESGIIQSDGRSSSLVEKALTLTWNESRLWVSFARVKCVGNGPN